VDESAPKPSLLRYYSGPIAGRHWQVPLGIVGRCHKRSVYEVWKTKNVQTNERRIEYPVFKRGTTWWYKFRFAGRLIPSSGHLPSSTGQVFFFLDKPLSWMSISLFSHYVRFSPLVPIATHGSPPSYQAALTPHACPCNMSGLYRNHGVKP